MAWELRSAHPMLDVRLFRNRRFSASSVAIALAFFALFGMIFFLTQYLQSILGYSAFEAGIRTLPVAGGLVLGGPLSAKLVERLGTKVVVAAGLTLVATGLGLLTFAEADSGYGLIAVSLLVARLRHGHGDGARDRRDHGLAPAGQGQRRLSGQRRDAHDGRRARRRHPRLRCCPAGTVATWRTPSPGCPLRPPTAARSRSPAPSAVASQIGGAAGERILDAAQAAFVTGMHTAALVAARIALAGAVIALVWLPAREADAGRAETGRGRRAAPGAASSRPPRDRSGPPARPPALGRGRRRRSCGPRSRCSSPTATAR